MLAILLHMYFQNFTQLEMQSPEKTTRTLNTGYHQC